METMEEKTRRFDSDGEVVEDVMENPKAVERKLREANDRARLEAESKEPWSRAKVERELGRLALKPRTTVIDGREIFDRLNLHGVDLSGLDLSGLDFSGVNMHGANLTGSILSGCRLVDANLCEATLTGAAFEQANAFGANLNKACLCAAKIGKTHFMTANLSESCCEATEGLDIVTNPLTPAEAAAAKYKQAEGFRVEILYDDKEQGNARVLYVGATLEKANISSMKTVCQRRKI